MLGFDSINIPAIVGSVDSPLRLAALIAVLLFIYSIWVTPRGGSGGSGKKRGKL